MEKNIKYYLNFYFGCECEISDLTKRMVLEGWEEGRTKIGGYLLDCMNDCTIKPILRKLCSMTEEERLELDGIYARAVIIDDYPFKTKLSNGDWEISKSTRSRLFMDSIVSANMTQHLLSKGFDLFGLIESGLAIDKETLLTPPL